MDSSHTFSLPTGLPQESPLMSTMYDEFESSPWAHDTDDLHSFRDSLGNSNADSSPADLYPFRDMEQHAPLTYEGDLAFQSGIPNHYPDWSGQPYSQSLLLTPFAAHRFHESGSNAQQPFYSLDHALPSSPYAVEQRHPQIHIDTSALDAFPLIQMPQSSIQSPYDYPPPFSRRSSIATPSSTGSLLLPTPDTSPMIVSDRSGPFINEAQSSPISPSTVIAFDQQALLYDTNAREDRGQTVLHTVPQLAMACSSPEDGPLVPQRTYRPHTQSDRKRYVDEVELQPAIMFYMENPVGCGIPLRDALNCKFIRLAGRDDQMFEGRGPSVSIRLMWPGYAPWSRQIPTRDFRSPPQPITRAKLAKNVAKTIVRFIKDMEGREMEEDADPRWKVGKRHINIDHLVVVGLQHVSMGSWQAHLRLGARA